MVFVGYVLFDVFSGSLSLFVVCRALFVVAFCLIIWCCLVLGVVLQVVSCCCVLFVACCVLFVGYVLFDAC